jgi:CheY-like chemotaxis protein
VLLTEDNPINCKLGVVLLEKMGHLVTTAINGSECIAVLGQAEFDLVLMDIQMPGMSGEEALVEIRRNEKITGSRLPVIAMTAYALRGDQEHFLAEGFDGYVSKPLVVEELIAEMKRVVGDAHAAND